ncbi:MAG: VWA domain-containing protein [Sandaracinus sp.]|nr:VWA domain-containing protein [Sandaracinus sp.]MCB9624534.1 VWA domain-containing protein [Sandaracinus sp.]MCB9635027.1 VWA domain-containing protein [Sandaracinus sp.]
MTWLSPWSLLWLGLTVPLVLLYVLKRKHVDRVIGSTLLWEAALRDLRAERPWKRLIPTVALLLQLLAIVLGALALGRPAGAGGVPTGATVALVVDTSASMAARSGHGGSRLERAVEVGRELARALPPGGRMMVVAAGAEPTVLAPPTSDGAALARALDALAPSGTVADLEGAVALTTERLREAPSGSRVLLVTDGAEDGEISLDVRGAPVEVQLVGPEENAATDNVGIVEADARARVGEGPDRADLFARLRNYAPEPVDVFLTATLVGRDGVLASRRLTLDAESSAPVVMAVDLPPDAAGRAAVVRLALSRHDASVEGMDDDLALDDVAVVPSPGARRLPVFLVGDAPAPVERVLRADAHVELFATTLRALAERDADAPPLDGLFVYAGETPERAPAGDSIVVAPRGDRVFETELGPEVEAPRMISWDEADPRLRFVTLSDVHLGRLRPITGSAARALATTDAGPALASLSRPDGETTIVAFDPATSDWPRQPTFVVFFRNLLERARERRASGGVAKGALGEALRIPAPDGTRVDVRTPSGETLTATSRGGIAVVPVAAEPGVFEARVALDGGPRELHALRSLLDASESDVRARLQFSRAGETVTTAPAAPREHRESWPWLAALVLLFFALEAWWASRKGAVA